MNILGETFLFLIGKNHDRGDSWSYIELLITCDEIANHFHLVPERI